jgi:hypothetical protein
MGYAVSTPGHAMNQARSTVARLFEIDTKLYSSPLVGLPWGPMRTMETPMQLTPRA